MENKDFSTMLLADASPATVFNAVNNVRGWWSQNIAGATDLANAEFEYHYQDVHRCKMKITELVPNQKVVWTVLENYFKFTDQPEWTGNRLVFDIAKEGEKTRLTFTQEGLLPGQECYQVCNDAWTHYIQDSLKQLIETGEGKATPKDSGEAGVDTAPALSAETKSIWHRLLIEVPVEVVYGALTTQKGLAGWWTTDTVAEPVIGSISRFTFGGGYFKEMEVIALTPYSSITWKCLKGHDEWVGTTLSFTMEPHRKGCVLSFEHAGFAEYTPGFASCSYDWALFLRSLKLLCETGKGKPFPEFNK